MRQLKVGAIGLFVLAMVCGQAVGANFDRMVIFGDSLLDTGNSFLGSGGAFPPSPPYGGIPGVHFPLTDPSPFPGRFSDGANLADGLATGLGLSAAPLLAGGSNYAFGGAVTGLVPATYTPTLDVNPFTPGNDPVTVQGLTYLQQIGAYLGNIGGGAEPAPTPNTLFVIWTGANDLVLNDTIGPGKNSVKNIEVGINALIAAGAQQILVANLPSLDVAPALRQSNPTPSLFVSQDLTGSLDGDVNRFNSKLGVTLAKIQNQNQDVTVFEFDVHDILNRVLDGSHPAAGLFNNTTIPVIDEQALFEPPPSLVVNANPFDSLYWDGVHVTTLAHQVLAGEALALLNHGQALTVTPEPGTAVLTVLTLVGLVGGRRRRPAA